MTTNLQVANEIARQIGARAFLMMGTQHKLGTENSLIFDVRGSKVKKITVELTPMDTYWVTFYGRPARRTMAGSIDPVTLHVATDIYADGLAQCIEANTGLCLSL